MLYLENNKHNPYYVIGQIMMTLRQHVSIMMFGNFTLLLRFGLIWLMVLNATFNNISVISCQSVLLVEETGIPGENHGPVASH